MIMPEFDPKFSLGNLVTIATMIVGMTLGYAKLATKEEVKQETEKVRSESVTKDVNTLQIQLITNQMSALQLRVEEIRNDVKTIKSRQ